MPVKRSPLIFFSVVVLVQQCFENTFQPFALLCFGAFALNHFESETHISHRIFYGVLNHSNHNHTYCL